MFYPAGYEQAQRKKKRAHYFSLFTWGIALSVFLSPVMLSRLSEATESIVEVKEEVQVLGITEMNVDAEQHFATFSMAEGEQIGEIERKRVIHQVSSEIDKGDTRAIVLRAYLETFRCGGTNDIPPLAEYADDLVAAADKYGLDWKVTTGIAGVESWFGCAGGAPVYRNAWGYGGGPETRYRYDTWEEAIDDYSKGLAEGYGTNIHTRLYDVASYYVYGHAGRHDAWADGVTGYIHGIERMEKDLLE